MNMTPAQLETAFPELFKIARQIRARGGDVRMHSVRIGEIDPDTGLGGERVELVQDPGEAP